MTAKVRLLAYTILMATIIFAAYSGLIPVKLHNIPFYDSAGHFVLYGFWGYFFGRAFPQSVISIRNFRFPLGIATAAFIAVAEEFIQMFFPVRSFSFGDLAYGFLGIAVSCIALNLWRR